jgi:HEAT repeat protein
MPVLLGAARDADPRTRDVALMALAEAGGPEAEQALRDAARSPDLDVRRAAASSLVQLDSPAAAAELERMVRDPDPGVQEQALSGLVQSSPERASALISERARSEDATVRASAVALAMSLDEATQRSVADVALGDTDPRVVQQGISLLGQLGTRDAQEKLAALLSSSPSEEVRRAAASTLEGLGGEVAARMHAAIQALSGASEGVPTPGADGLP